MQSEEEQINSPHLTEQIPAVMPLDEKQADSTSTTSSSLQEYRGYIPSIFRGINTSGSYHVYGDHHLSVGKPEGDYKHSPHPRGGAASQARNSQVHNANMAHSDSAIVVSHPRFPTTSTQPAGAPGIIQGPAAPMEEDSIQHPHTSCIRLSSGFSKGVICSPQSPLRSDCQPNSPTESSSSRNATMSLKQASEYPKEAKARNWKKYKYIVLNQIPSEHEQEVQGGNVEATVMSPTLSPCRTGGAGEGQADDGASEHGHEMPRAQSVDSCSNTR